MLQSNKIFKSAFLLTVVMILFKIIGFIKQAIIAYTFGATVETDIYFVASEFIVGCTAAIAKAIGIAMITIYSTVLIQQGRVAASKLVAAFIEITFPIMLFFAGIVCIISPVLSNILAPGFVGEEHDLLIKYCRILSISFVFVSFEMVFGSVLDSEKSFFIPRLQSLINSACMIGACFFLVDYFDVGSLIIAQYLSSIIYAVLLFAAMRKYINVYFVNPFKEKNVIAVLKKALPLILGNSVLYVNGIVDRMIASNLDEGTVSSLTYCHVLEDFVINVIVVNICNVLFAHFADIVAHNDSEQITRLIYQAIAILVTILTPVAIVTFLCSEQIVSIAYYRGDFNWNMVETTAIALSGYAIAFPFVAIREILIKGIFAYGDTFRPMKNSFICIAINIICSIILSRYIGVLGIAYGTVISVIISNVLNAYDIKKYINNFKYNLLIRIMAYNCITAVISFYITKLIRNYLYNNNDIIIFVGCTLMCCIIHFMILAIANWKYIKDFFSEIKK